MRRLAAVPLAALVLSGCTDRLPTESTRAAHPRSQLAASCAPTIKTVELDDLGGGEDGAYDINAAGDVVGWSATSSGQYHAVLWSAAGMPNDLGTLGGSYSEALGVNNNGAVVGVSETTGGDLHAFLWTAATGMIDLGTLGGSRSDAIAINDMGQITGRSRLASGEMRAFLWTPTTPGGTTGTMTDLGTVLGSGPGPESSGSDIDANGMVVGVSTAGSAKQDAMLWASGAMMDLGTLPGDVNSTAYGMNDQKEVVGTSRPMDGTFHAFLWTSGGGMTDLGSLTPGNDFNIAWDVDNSGRVVGFSGILGKSRSAFLWIPTVPGGTTGSMLDLGPFPGYDDSRAFAINDKGLIVGESYSNATDVTRAILWMVYAQCEGEE